MPHAASGTIQWRVARGILLLAAVAGLSCATTGHSSAPAPTLTYEQHTLRIPIRIEASGAVSFAERPPLSGRIDLAPVLAAEGLQGKSVPAQAMLHYGRLYVAADAFRSVWEITPQPGTSTAVYRAIPVPHLAAAAHLQDVRLSRYGSSKASCLRVDHAGGAPLFITPGGEARDECP